jgi:uncharacterized protein (TIGR03790 family)
MRPILIFYLFFVLNGISQTINYKDVAVVVNLNSEASEAIGNHFKTSRNIPLQNVIYIDAPTTEIIDSFQFILIKNQIENYLVTNNLKDSINYIVTTKGVPLKVGNNCVFDTLPGMSCASFDSEIGLILGDYASFIGKSGPLQNPYYGNNTHFSKTEFGFYLVTRLDGYTLSDVINLIDRSGHGIGINKNTTQTVVDISNGYDNDSVYFSSVFIPAYNFLSENSWNSILDLNFEALYEQSNVFLYLGIGHGPLPFQQLNYEFVKGSASIMEMCSSSYTFDFNSKGQNDLLLGDLIAEGCTAGYGNVDYIFFGNIISPELFVERYLNATQNYNLAESFYMAGRTLSWQSILIGDPKSSITIDNTADILEDNFLDLKVFPNPFTQKLSVSSSEQTHLLQIVDLNGALVAEFPNMEKGQTILNLNDLKVGIYLLRIIDENKIHRQLIIKN